jgi:hypothetical protein
MTTTYILVLNDGFNSATDSILVVVNPLPGTPAIPLGPDTVDMANTLSSIYTTTMATAANSYVWELTPSNAGTISGTDTIGTIVWNQTYLGSAYIKVKAINGCGESSWSIEKITFVDNTTGILKYNPVTLVLYPNPNNGIFFIQSSEKVLKVIIFEQFGKPIDEIGKPDENRPYDFGRLSAGVYFVRIIGTQWTTVQKFLIVH